jgi:hypothetical protein
MIGDCGGVDVGGNPYGVDWSSPTNDGSIMDNFTDLSGD